MAELSQQWRFWAKCAILSAIVAVAIALFVYQWLPAPPPASAAPLAATPALVFSNEEIPDSIALGESVDLEFQIGLRSGTGDHGGISVSFPDLTARGGSSSSYDSVQGTVTTVSYTNGSSHVAYFDEGDQIFKGNDANRSSADYLLVESDDNDWPGRISGGDYVWRTLILRVTPKESGPFRIYSRFWLCGSGYEDCDRRPRPEHSDEEDQQRWSVYEDTVRVSGPTSGPFSRNSAEDFDGLDEAGNDSPEGIWSDGTTMWVADYSDDKIYAYNLSTKARDSSKDFDTLDAADNESPTGIWSDGTTMWVADSSDDKIYAYNMSDKARVSSKDFDTLDSAGNGRPEGIWSDGATMWVADSSDDKIYAYNMSDKARVSSKDFDTLEDAENDHAAGIWSDGTTMWVADYSDEKIYAYNLSTKARDSSKDFDTLEDADNDHAAGIWSDRTTMWVADYSDEKIYAYNAPETAVSNMNRAPTVTGTPPTQQTLSLTTGDSQTFTAAATDADSNMTKWKWVVDKRLSLRHGHNEPEESFAATGSITKAFSHTFPDNGTYDVTATFTDSDRNSGTAEWRVEVEDLLNHAPIVSRVPSSPSQVSLFTSDSHTFTAAATDADNNMTKWKWVVDKRLSLLHGHNEPEESFAATGSITKTFSHTFPDNGTYDVTATFTDSQGDSGSVSWTVEVTDNRAPTVAGTPPTQQTLSLTTGDSQTFTAAATDADNNMTKWKWVVDKRLSLLHGHNEPEESFAATGSITKTFSHTFPNDGTYDVTATFTDSQGDSGTAEWRVEVEDLLNHAPIVSRVPSSPSQVSLFTSDSHTFTAAATDADSNMTKWKWVVDKRLSLRHGHNEPEESFAATGSITKTFSHTFTDNGTYDVTATFTDSQGDSGSVSWTVEVTNNRAPTVAGTPPTQQTLSLTTGDSQTFTAAATDADNNMTKWKWVVDKRLSLLHGHNEPEESFAATGSITKTFSHTFPNDGTYDVTATFTDSQGDSGSVSWEVEVEVEVEVIGEDQTIFSTLGVRVAATCEISPDVITPGQNITFTSKVTGLETPLNSDINIYMKPTIAEAVRGIDASDEVPFKTNVASIGEGDEVTLTYQGATLYPGTYDFGCRLYWELPGDIPDKELTTSQSPTTPVVVDGYGQFYGSANKSKLTECKAANPAPLAGQSVELRTHGFWRQGDVARYFSGRVYVSHGGDIVENFFGFLPFDLFQQGGLRTLAKKSYTFDSPGVYTMDCELYSHPSAYPPSDPFASLTDKIRAGLAAYFSPASVTGGLQSFRGVMTNTLTVVEARWGDDQVSISPNPLPQGGGTITAQVHTEESTTKQTAVPAPMFSIEDLSESKTAGTCGHDDLSGYTRRCWEATFTIPENDLFESISYEVAVSSGQITGTRTGSFAVAPLPPPSVDRPALVALYNATGGANWPVKTNWLSNNPVGEWQGVTTDVERGRVTRLDLLGNRLSGEIPVELGSLSNLKLLDLGANGLSGEIPVELGSLSNLESLDLGANRLRGNIPVQLGNLTSLLWLELTDNQLSGNIPPSLGRLTNLEILDLGENKLTGSIPPELGSMTNLDTLHLNDNELSGEIPSELAGLANLVSLRLDGNRLTGCIPQGLRGTDTNDLRLGLPFCDVLLSGLTINPGTLTPQFQSSHTNYTAEASQLRITVVPTNDHNAAFQFLDENDVGIPDADGALDGHQVDLGNGFTTIKVKVTSQDNGASHTYTIRVTTVGLPGAPEITGPITPGATSLTVSWTGPGETGSAGITSYDLRYIESTAVDKADVNWTVVEDVWTTGPLNYTIEDLTGGVQYDVQVRADTSVGTGPWSATSSGAPQATPGAPEITGPITPGAASLTVSWTGPGETGGTVIASYDLRYIESAAADKADANWSVLEGAWDTGLLTYTIFGLAGGTQYDVQIRAVTRVGAGSWSETSTGTPTMSGCSTGGAVAGAANNPGLVADCEVLLEARDTLAGASSLDWLAITPVGDWSGITLSGTPQRVTGLDLTNRQLTGSISAALGSLIELQSLRLSNNQLTGEIPRELARLSNLSSMALSQNQLDGCIPEGLRDVASNDLTSLGLPFCDVLLSGLTITPGTLTPEFEPGVTDYTADVEPSQITITPANDHNAAFLFLDEEDSPIQDADDAMVGHQVELGYGAATIKVRVISQDNEATHTYTIVVSRVGLPGTPAITGPITPGDQVLTVEWSAPANDGGTVITGYDLRFIRNDAPDKADANWTVVEDTWTTGSLIYTIEGLTGGAQYDVQVRAVSSVGAGPWSATSSGVPQATPGAPAIGLLTPGDSALTVEWSAPATDGGSDVTGYDLRYIRSDAPDKADANWTIRSSISNSGGLRYDLEGLTNGAAYQVQVRAVNVSGTGPWSETFTGTPATWWAIRSLSPESVEPGGEVEVTITAAGYGALGGQVVETLPDGFSYVGSDLDEEAIAVADQAVTFILFGTGPSTFTYTVTASSEEGTYSFSGVLRNEDLEEQPVGGASTIAVTTDTAPEFPATETGERRVLESAPESAFVGDPVAATGAGSEPLTYTLGGDDAALFTIDASAGQIRVKAGTTLDPDIRDTYTVVVTATGASGASADITVTIMVVGLLTQYDSDSDGSIGRGEAIEAIVDYFAGRLTRGQTIAVIVLYFSSGN